MLRIQSFVEHDKPTSEESVSMNDDSLLDIKNLMTYFFTMEGVAKAVDGVNLSVSKGESVGIVGESGCGKSVTAFSVLQLIPQPPGKIVGGNIIFKGQDLLTLSEYDMRKIRGNNISMIFQEPMSSLNPLFTIGDQIQESLMLHKSMSKKESLEKAIDILRGVKIPAPEKCVMRFPHELSGGMRQRVMIAMALACEPALMIADEPTTALDVTIQAQIIDLISNLQEKMGMALILITHNLGLIAEMVTRVAVMYAGKVVEEATTRCLFENPRHPYTVGLLNSFPRIRDKLLHGKRRLAEIPGIVPSLYDLPKGCSFSERCSDVMDVCREKQPELKKVSDGHYCKCWRAEI